MTQVYDSNITIQLITNNILFMPKCVVLRLDRFIYYKLEHSILILAT